MGHGRPRGGGRGFRERGFTIVELTAGTDAIRTCHAATRRHVQLAVERSLAHGNAALGRFGNKPRCQALRGARVG
jgi:hypothetical protein